MLGQRPAWAPGPRHVLAVGLAAHQCCWSSTAISTCLEKQQPRVLLQIKRVIARDWALFRQHSAYRGLTDGHDNNWLLAEFALALPFAVGFKTAAVSRLLALCLSLEALTCWRFWKIFPTW